MAMHTQPALENTLVGAATLSNRKDPLPKENKGYTSITICSVSNGWVLYNGNNEPYAKNSIVAVFNSLPAMQAWITNNLTNQQENHNEQ
jgi:hypothetical protein